MRLRYSFLLVLAALLLAPSAVAQNDLVLTGVFDGSLTGGNPKGVELFVVNDVADLSLYAVGSANNGGGTDGAEFALSGSASAGDYLYVVNGNDGFNEFFGFSAGFEAGSAVSINGDDAIELFYDGAGFPADLSTYTGTPTVVDTFGDIDVDGSGQAWEYLDGWAYRTAGTGPDGGTFVVGNWTFSGVDGLEGGTDNASAMTPFPVGTYGAPASTNPSVRFTGGADVTEGETATLTVEISYPAGVTTTEDVVVEVAYTGGSATADDFTGATSATLTFPAGADGAQDATFATAAGGGFEGPESATFGLTVTSGTADVGTPNVATVTITDDEAAPSSTIAEARAAGVGATVSVTGTVTRAQGDFLYLQDDTAGLAIRQTSGDLFNAVADGTVGPGTVLSVQGTLSEFRNLLQLNEGNLTGYTVNGTEAVPTPQVVTLAQIAANGEDFEGELVVVNGVTIDPDGDTEFAASETYAITDASDATGSVALRTAGADDGEADGTAIPTTAANVTAIVTQFAQDPSTGATTGYQLLVIGANDVQAATDDEDGVERAALSLTVANPVRGAATVRFETGAPGRATLSLYDALGRRVAVVADGAFDGSEQSATLDAGALASGVYVLRLQTEGGAASRTLTVVR